MTETKRVTQDGARTGVLVMDPKTLITAETLAGDGLLVRVGKKVGNLVAAAPVAPQPDAVR